MSKETRVSLRRNADTEVVDERTRRTRDSDRPDRPAATEDQARQTAAVRPGGGSAVARANEADRHGVGTTRVSNRGPGGQGTTQLWPGGGAARNRSKPHE